VLLSGFCHFEEQLGDKEWTHTGDHDEMLLCSNAFLGLELRQLNRWQGLDVELCLSLVHVREGQEAMPPPEALVCLRTHLVPGKLEPCPTSNYKADLCR